MRAGIAGVPISSCEVKLESCPDLSDKAKMPYLIDDTRDVEGNRIFGRGEVLVRGNNVSLGYYMMEEKVRERSGAERSEAQRSGAERRSEENQPPASTH